MKDKVKTKEQLIAELVEMRQRVAELEATETARQRAEEALRESEARYRYFVEQTAEGFYRIESEEPILIKLPEDEQIRDDV